MLHVLQVMVGELPNDFLRTGPSLTQEQEDERIARILQAQQQAGVNVVSAGNIVGRLSISVVQVGAYACIIFFMLFFKNVKQQCHL